MLRESSFLRPPKLVKSPLELGRAGLLRILLRVWFCFSSMLREGRRDKSDAILRSSCDSGNRFMSSDDFASSKLSLNDDSSNSFLLFCGLKRNDAN